MHLIDRRLNGRNKSAVNRARFVRRYREQIRESVRRMVSERSIRDMDRGGAVGVPVRDISEPTFSHAPGGDRETVHPGNRDFSAGDRVPRPQQSGGQGRGGEPGQGDATDEFVFTLSREEFLSIFFDDLELPHLVRSELGSVEQKKFRRAGFVTSGSPTNLSVVRTMRTALGRRIALSGAIDRRIEDAESRLGDVQSAASPGDTDAHARVGALLLEIEDLRRQKLGVPFLDDLDLRYRNRIAVPAPVARAVMFCLMDVSASMDEDKKDLAKRFFTLLYLFLTRKYEHVELVFIRHTDNAEEVDENTFFHDTRSGGTVVLSALELMHEIVGARYAGGGWNVYGAQASDGDAFGADAGRSARFLREKLIPLTRYFAYIEAPDPGDMRTSSLWVEYQEVERSDAPRFAMRRVTRRDEIYPVFRELFRREKTA